jgi:hypothetical protein
MTTHEGMSLPLLANTYQSDDELLDHLYNEDDNVMDVDDSSKTITATAVKNEDEDSDLELSDDEDGDQPKFLINQAQLESDHVKQQSATTQQPIPTAPLAHIPIGQGHTSRTQTAGMQQMLPQTHHSTQDPNFAFAASFTGSNFGVMFPEQIQTGGTGGPKVNNQLEATDIEQFEDKPWRKPGANIADYFNYGFDEQSWTLYCNKQNGLRAEQGMQNQIRAYDPNGGDRYGHHGHYGSHMDDKYRDYPREDYGRRHHEEDRHDSRHRGDSRRERRDSRESSRKRSNSRSQSREVDGHGDKEFAVPTIPSDKGSSTPSNDKKRSSSSRSSRDKDHRSSSSSKDVPIKTEGSSSSSSSRDSPRDRSSSSTRRSSSSVTKDSTKDVKTEPSKDNKDSKSSSSHRSSSSKDHSSSSSSREKKDSSSTSRDKTSSSRSSSSSATKSSSSSKDKDYSSSSKEERDLKRPRR